MSFQAQAKKVINTEAQAIQSLIARIDGSFDKACALINSCVGRVVVIGVGKSGLVGNKIAATLASTGTPAFAINAAEASHGDLGMVKKGDVILAISYSGQTEEIIALLPVLKKRDLSVISLCGNPHSPLARFATVNLDVGIKEEACPLGLAPTTSTTATLVLGDAMAIALLVERGFTHEDFALSHPGGSLGKRLLVTVADLMHKGAQIPMVCEQDPLDKTLLEMTQKGLGTVCVLDAQQKLIGMFTDGDLRRAFANKVALSETQIQEVMTPNPKTIVADALAINALGVMEHNKITALPVMDHDHRLVGVIHMHALLSAGIQGAQHAETLTLSESKKSNVTYS